MPSPSHRHLAQQLALACACSLLAGGATAAVVVSGNGSFAQQALATTQAATQIPVDMAGLGRPAAWAEPAEVQPGFVFTSPEDKVTAWHVAPASARDSAVPQQMVMAEPGSLALAGLGLAACLLLDRLERRRRRY